MVRLTNLFSIDKINNKFSSMLKICSLISFIFKRNIFELEYPYLILKILGKLVELEYPNFKGDSYRSPEDCSKLFNNLVESYLSEKSGKTLEQIVSILRDEILDRGLTNGRK